MKLWIVVLLVLSAVGLIGCDDAEVERRARDAAEKLQDSIPDVVGDALKQKVSEEEIKQAQQALSNLKEYMGEVNGRLDPVTIHSIQAFQRSQGMEDDGLLNFETQQALLDAGGSS